MKIISLVALGLVALASAPAHAANWSDTSIGYRYGTQFREPGLVGTLTKDIVSLTHVSGWDYGSNFFNVDMLMSNGSDPAQNAKAPNFGGGQPGYGVSGANEVYVTYHSAFSLGKIFKTNMAFGPVKDISFTGGLEFNSKENEFASKKRFLLAGPTINFNVKGGFFDLGIWACHEQNYNGVVMKSVDFKTTYEISAAWGVPFEMGVGAEFKGFANYVGAKGKDGFGVETKPEILADLAVMFDISGVFGRKPKAVFVGVGYEFWNNKFGGVNNTAPANMPWTNNERVTAPMAQLEIHF
jgi:nucleoside-specific outer membrane channel protein Tsx